METRLQVVYDDTCHVCRVLKSASERLDHAHAVKFVGMSTPEGKQLVDAYRLDTRRSAYAIRLGVVREKSRMMREVLAHNGFLGYLVSLPFRFSRFGDRLYEFTAQRLAH